MITEITDMMKNSGKSGEIAAIKKLLEDLCIFSRQQFLAGALITTKDAFELQMTGTTMITFKKWCRDTLKL